MATIQYHNLPSNPGPPDQASEPHEAVKTAVKGIWKKPFLLPLSRKRILTAITGILFTILVTITTILTRHSDISPSNKTNLTREECNFSPSEARQTGCVFDPVLMGWVPWRCHDPALARDFLSQRNWTFFQSPDRVDSHVMSLTEVLRGEWDNLYVDPEFYIVQCMYTWKKTWRAAMNRSGVLDGYLGDDHHRNHCEMLITAGPEREKSVYMKYVSCPWGHHGSSGRFGWYRVIGGKRIYRADA